MAVFGYSSTCNNASASWALEAKVDLTRGTKEVKTAGDSFARV